MDFVAGSPDAPLPIEVKLVDTLDLRDRRLAGLALFLRRYPHTRRAVVVSRSTSAVVEAGAARVEAIPLAKFLLDPGT